MTISVSDNKRQYMKELWKRDKYPVFSFNFHAVHIGLISIWLWFIMTSHLLRKVSDNNRELRFGVSGKRKTTGRYLRLVKPRGKYSYTDIPLLLVFDLTCPRAPDFKSRINSNQRRYGEFFKISDQRLPFQSWAQRLLEISVSHTSSWRSRRCSLSSFDQPFWPNGDLWLSLIEVLLILSCIWWRESGEIDYDDIWQL